MMLTDEEIAAFVESGYEIRAVEFKGPASTTSSEFVANVARAALALANQRDGGFIILGVDESNPSRSGLTPEQKAQWLDYDDVVDKLNRYADPPLRIDRAARALPDGRDVVVLQIAEFDDIPILAARDYGRTIQKGQLYTRSFRKPESSARQTQNELRGVLDLATQKQLSRFLALAAAANVPLGDGDPAPALYDAESAVFQEEAGIDDIVTSAYFHFAVRPDVYDAERVDFSALGRIVRQAAVHVRGWPYPFVEHPQNGATWITEQETMMHREAWVAFESGQFQSWHAIPLDGRHRADRRPAPEPGHGYFAYWMPATEFTEVLLFTQRLQHAIAPTTPFTVTLSLRGAKGWELVAGDPRSLSFSGEHRLQTDAWERTVHVPAGGGGTARDLAIAPAVHLLHRFGWAGANPQIVQAVQDSAFGPV